MTEPGFLLVALYAYGDLLSPQKLTEALGAAPTRSHSKGDAKVLRDGNRTIHATGMWELRSACESRDLNAHVDNILRRIATVCNVNEFEGVDVFHLDVHLSEMQPGDGYRFMNIELEHGLLSQLAALGAGIRISVVD